MAALDWVLATEADPRRAATWEIRRRQGMSMTAPVHRGVVESVGLYTFCGRWLKPFSRFEMRPYLGTAPARACLRCWPNGR